MSRLDFLLVEPTNGCGLQCPLCPTGAHQLGRPKGLLDPSMLDRLLARPDVHGPAALLWGWGEPTLHPGLAELVGVARRHGCAVEVQSNGHGEPSLYERLVEVGLETLTIALDGLEDEQVHPLRGPTAAINSVRRLLQRLAPRMGATQLQVQCLATALNQDVLQEIRHWVEALPATFMLKTLNTTGGSPELVELLTPRREELRREKPGHRPACHEPCSFLRSGASLLWDGTVVPCCYDWRGAHPLGTVQDSWTTLSRRRADFRWQDAAMCGGCSIGPAATRTPFQAPL